MHVPVLLKEVIEYLTPEPGKKFVDATVGEGGHAREIIKRGGMVLGIDQDPEVLKHDPLTISPSRGGEKAGVAVQGNFADLKQIALENDFAPADGILFDLGMGSHQLDDPSRGFAFQKEGPLDMRFDQTKGKTAGEFLNYYPEKELIAIFENYGEEKRFAKKIARAILLVRKARNLTTTTDLFELIKSALPGKFRYKTGDVARRIFQALRIAVNQELKSLELALPQALDILKLHGRIVVISFHSLEDRIVKRFFQKEAKNCVCPPEFPICVCKARAKLRILTKKPITASAEEITINPRSKSAKLRVAKKIWENSSP